MTKVRKKLHQLVFDDKKDTWDRYLLLFAKIVDKLGSYDQERSDAEKKIKVLRILFEANKPIAMVHNVTKMSFNVVIGERNVDVERERNVHKP